MGGVKKNMTKGIEGMQSALETESKGKAEGLRMKKKLESDVGDLEMSLEHANANNVETQKAIKNTKFKLETPKLSLRRSHVEKPWDMISSLTQIAKLMRCRMLWKNLDPFLRLPIETVE